MARIYLSPPHVGARERELLLDAFDSNWIAPLGPHVDAFERELALRVGRPQAVALSSGTAALHLALLVLGVGPGDEVLTSTLTFAASTNAIRYVGARPCFIDSEPETWNVDPGLLAEELDRRSRAGCLPKALLIVDVFGRCADWAPIMESAQRYGIPVVEDAAEALGASYRGAPAGSFGDLAAFSFNGNKIITTSGGGALCCDSEDTARRVRHLATQAREPAPHYEHVDVGYNYRLSNLLAALGRAQLEGLESRIERRRAINRAYRSGLARLGGIEVTPEPAHGSSNAWLTTILVDEAKLGASREDVRRHLETLDIEARPVWKPMHLQPVYREFPVVGGSVSERVFERGLCLPSGSSLTPDEQQRVIDAIGGCARRLE